MSSFESDNDSIPFCPYFSSRAFTIYTYDLAGNVKRLDQWNALTLYKGMEYKYDLISGKVNEVRYQPGAADQFIHRYVYDADNRITKVRTSRDGLQWEEDARYFYYPHGPLSRVELGEYNLQGLDYYYTLHGWLKGINGPGNQLDEDIDFIASTDPGLDGYTGTGNLHRWTGRDELGLGLGYFNGDYTPIGTAAAPALSGAFTGMAGDILQNGLYNGNIAWMATMLPELGRGTAPQPVLEAYAFKYDQLHRIRHAGRHQWTGSTWAQPDANAYRTAYAYDANGNITGLDRYGADGTHLDDLTYHYNVDGSGHLTDNRLLYVADPEGAHTVGDLAGQGSGNYAYDGIGNLTKDEAEGITLITWNPQGKVKEVKKAYVWNQSYDLEFRYDGMGQRVMKIVKPHAGIDILTGNIGYRPKELWIYTIYVRDASGNVMAIYDRHYNDAMAEPLLSLEEQPIYGSSRVGMYKYTINSENKRILGSKRYELTNHLGNVNAVITDVRIGVDDFEWDGTGWVAGADGIVDYYRPTVESAYDYYPFGAPMPGRTFNPSDYRYGMNTQEKVDEISGAGNHYTAQFWEYDPRIARRWNTDPKPQVFISDYAVFANNPVIYNDVKGDKFRIGGDQQSKNDVFDLVSKKNQKYIKIDDQNNVTLDFEGLKQSKVDRIIRNDKGISLVHDLFTADEQYLYEASTHDIRQIRSTGEIIEEEILPTNPAGEQISNYSITPRNINGGAGTTGAAPGQPGVDGYVRISPGSFYTTITTTYDDGTSSTVTIQKQRSSTVFHELAESYARTTLKMPYIRTDGSGAHQYSINREGPNYYGNPHPGRSTGFTPPKEKK